MAHRFVVYVGTEGRDNINVEINLNSLITYINKAKIENTNSIVNNSKSIIESNMNKNENRIKVTNFDKLAISIEDDNLNMNINNLFNLGKLTINVNDQKRENNPKVTGLWKPVRYVNKRQNESINKSDNTKKSISSENSTLNVNKSIINKSEIQNEFEKDDINFSALDTIVLKIQMLLYTMRRNLF
ncbi:hypothetical protein K502DRAFT_348767 [Neoconidiobolus thromboides FSU 785]|nr:hypothetical protein K502DRAFT_348767 [Neoconidiobolus thromboides FSU 785]